MKESIANHLFVVVHTKEQQDQAKEWLKVGKVFDKERNYLKLNEFSKKNLILSICRS
jgi:hypothetical protein